MNGTLNGYSWAGVTLHYAQQGWPIERSGHSVETSQQFGIEHCHISFGRPWHCIWYSLRER